MNLILTILIVAAVAAVVFYAAHRFGWVREGWLSELLGSWTARINAAGLLLLSWAQSDPVSMLSLWNMMPVDVRRVLPDAPVLAVGFALFIASTWARVRSKKA